MDMYTLHTLSCIGALKDKFLLQFTTKSPLRVMLSTRAFGMCINCHDVREMVHWEVSEDIEIYTRKVDVLE